MDIDSDKLLDSKAVTYRLAACRIVRCVSIYT